MGIWRPQRQLQSTLPRGLCHRTSCDAPDSLGKVRNPLHVPEHSSTDHRSSRAVRSDRKAESNRIASDARIALRGDISEALDSESSGSSGDEVDEPTAAQTLPADEADPFCGTAGQTVLSDAVSKAIEKFETKETEKIAKEYEMVMPEHEPNTRRVAVDGDFELVDRVEL